MANNKRPLIVYKFAIGRPCYPDIQWYKGAGAGCLEVEEAKLFDSRSEADIYILENRLEDSFVYPVRITYPAPKIEVSPHLKKSNHG